jgi:hypothetical protein
VANGASVDFHLNLFKNGSCVRSAWRQNVAVFADVTANYLYDLTSSSEMRHTRDLVRTLPAGH